MAKATDLLKKFSEDMSLAPDLRIQAAKALLPYEEKRQTQSFEFTANVNLNAEKLKDFSDDELRALKGFVERLTGAPLPGAGADETEIQPD